MRARTILSILMPILALALASLAPGAARAAVPPDWTEPVAPFRVAGNLYYVGSRGLASYLVTTPAGHILINPDLEANVPQIRASVEKLGFRMADVKVVLISHAHYDHAAGAALAKKLTGAAYMVMDGDVPLVESGGKLDFAYGDDPDARFPAVKVDRTLHDGDQVELGGVTLVAHKTAGHTPGCTTWTMRVPGPDRPLDVVIVGGPNVNRGYVLVGNRAYPEIAADYARGFRTLRSLPCDLFLGAHGAYFDLDAKLARMKDGAPNPFIDPDGYQAFVAQKEGELRGALDEQERAARGTRR